MNKNPRPTSQSGSNLSDIRIRNRSLILRLIATEGPISRVDIARMTGLTKTTASKIVLDLINEKIICETQIEPLENNMGRKPIYLEVSPSSPCVCGLLVKRGYCSAILADYKGSIFAKKDYAYTEPINGEKLVDILVQLFNCISKDIIRNIISIGISAIGPVDTVEQKLVNPPNFFRISDFPLAKKIFQKTGINTFLINDANAGALAEKIYGQAKKDSNFIYLHIMNGIGAGYIFQNKIYNGDLGQSGEIGHTSINFAGPVCDCGNTGCLEVYANIENINKKISRMQNIYPGPNKLPKSQESYSFQEVITAAEAGDFLALSALEDFCEYLSHALANAINLLDINRIIVGYESFSEQNIIESLLSEKLNSRVITAKYRKVIVKKSIFEGDAPLLGAIALVTNKLFSGEIKF